MERQRRVLPEMPSSEFRRTYAKLRQSVVVTVNGHGIGIWAPTAEVPRDAIPPFASQPNTPEREREIAERHEFSSRPFTPVPKQKSL